MFLLRGHQEVTMATTKPSREHTCDGFSCLRRYAKFLPGEQEAIHTFIWDFVKQYKQELTTP
jgi:hypothetical protein